MASLLFSLKKHSAKAKAEPKGFPARAFPCFFALLITLALLFITLVLPHRSYSPQRDESLAPFPAFSMEALWSGTYTQSLEEYLNDHFAMRDRASALCNRVKYTFGNNQINDIFILSDRLIKNVGTHSLAAADSNVNAIREFTDAYQQTTPCYFGLIPTASEIYKDMLPDAPKVLNQADFISRMYSELPDATIDISSNLTSQKSERLYYNTDSRWTSYGAYVGYTAIIKNLGGMAASLDQFSIEHASHDFYGDLYNQTLVRTNPADVIDLYHYKNGSVIERFTSTSSKDEQPDENIFFKDYLDTSHKQDTFLGSPAAVVTLTTNVKNGAHLLLFRDSYADALMQFLPLHYESITLVDLSLVNAAQIEAIHPADYSCILFLYHVDNFVSNNAIATKLPLI